MSFFTPDDFDLLLAHRPPEVLKAVVNCANSKLEKRIKEIGGEDGVQFLSRLIINENFKKSKRDKAMIDAYNAFQAITEDGVVDCLCCQGHERIAKEWLEKNETGFQPLSKDDKDSE